MKNSIYLLGLFLIATACTTSKKITTNSEYIQRDTIYKELIVEKIQAVTDTFTVDNPCDTSGLLSSFYKRISARQGDVIIEGKKGKLKATIKYYPFVLSDSKDYQIRYVTRTVYKEKETTKKDITPYLVLVIVIALFLYIRLSRISL
jgi:hypothetical protein